MPNLRRLARKALRRALFPEDPDALFLNEAVNLERQCIFIAVPKTGTTSVRTQLRPRGVPIIPTAHLDILQVRDSLYVYFLRKALSRNTSFPTESVPDDASIRAQAAEAFRTCFKFSAVRNPWARAASLYSRREGVQQGDAMSFAEFCRQHRYASDTCLHPTLHRNQIDWLCDESGTCIMDYVYKLEDFSTAIQEIAERTDGRVQLVDRNENRNPASKSRTYRDLYDDETQKLIAERFERDIDHFKYTF